MKSYFFLGGDMIIMISPDSWHSWEFFGSFLAAKVQMLTGTKIGIREIPDDPDNRSLNIAPRRKLQGSLNWRLAGTWDKHVTICLIGVEKTVRSDGTASEVRELSSN